MEDDEKIRCEKKISRGFESRVRAQWPPSDVQVHPSLVPTFLPVTTIDWCLQH